MTVYGFSHIVTEVESIDQSIAYYKNHGYDLEYQITQAVPSEKKSILRGAPETVDLCLLSHTSKSRIGIELIKHNKNFLKRSSTPMSHGWSTDSNENFIGIDPSKNIVFQITAPSDYSKQHIFIVSHQFDETIQFYKDIFMMRSLPSAEVFNQAYGEICGHYKRTLVLRPANCLTPSWDVSVHVIESTLSEEPALLNDVGFSCFCFIISQSELTRYKDLGIAFIGPLRGSKTLKNGKLVHFQFGFIRDPNGYLIEFYIP